MAFIADDAVELLPVSELASSSIRGFRHWGKAHRFRDWPQSSRRSLSDSPTSILPTPPSHLVEDSAERTKRAVDAVFGHQTPEPDADDADDTDDEGPDEGLKDDDERDEGLTDDDERDEDDYEDVYARGVRLHDHGQNWDRTAVAGARCDSATWGPGAAHKP